MTAARAYLAGIKERAQGATPGNWEASDSTTVDSDGAPIHCEVNVWSEHGAYIATVPEGSDGNAEFIAHSRTDLPRVADALLAVLELHHGNKWGMCEECSEHVDVPAPCQTVAAITSALEASL